VRAALGRTPVRVRTLGAAGLPPRRALLREAGCVLGLPYQVLRVRRARRVPHTV
jgi:hypothetical protein